MVARIEMKPIRGSSKRAQKQLRKMAAKIKNPQSVNRKIAVWLLRWVNQNFRSEGARVGGWKPFKHGGRMHPSGSIDTSAKLLQDTGTLRASFQMFYSRTTAGVGSNLRYSLSHEMGLPHVKLPARHMIPFEADRSIDDKVIRIYQHEIKRAGR